MKIAVIGSGYVGLTTAVAFAKMGHEVECIDIDAERVSGLQQGRCPIFEVGLAEELRMNLKAGRLSFSTQNLDFCQRSDVVFVAVGTPGNEDGSVRLSSFVEVTEMLGQTLNHGQIVAIKSTVPVGTGKALSHRFPQLNIVSNPEFLREGMALHDFLNPQRIILGTSSEKACEALRQLYQPLVKNPDQLMVMDSCSAEMSKYAANVMLASRVSLMNEISRLCEKTGADILSVQKGVGSDDRIGSDFLNAGLGFGGSCLPKDLSALISVGSFYQESLVMMNAIQKVNQTQKVRFAEKILAAVSGKEVKLVAIWGLSFKPGTDDIREAPALDVVSHLLKNGCSVRVFDPAASKAAQNYFRDSDRVFFADSPLQAVENCDALAVLTEWNHFRKIEMSEVKKLMRARVVLDGRNIFDPKLLRDLGFTYYSVGRP